MIKVLIVDDSALARQMLSQGLSRFSDIDIVGTASDVFAARDKIVFKKPDVITLDIEMPKMDGIEFLRRLMPQYPLPVIIVSALSKPGARVTLDALDLGAVDFVLKPSSSFGIHLEQVIEDLHEKIQVASRVDVSKYKRIFNPRPVSVPYKLSASTDKLIAIGASTGGTVAIQSIVEQLPADTPGTVIVQHMPPGFTTMFAERLNRSTPLEVIEAKGGERIHSGLVFLAPGDKHLSVCKKGGYFYTECRQGERVSGHTPSVDVLFHSVAEHAGANAVGVILTGMGRDGADGLKAMKDQKAITIAQDEKSCVVYGMPKEAVECGAVDMERDIKDIPSEIVKAVKRLSNEN
ncbi:MAG: chemotaxis response regulator protein-glutamate methylesterase [Spirochaetales bacterium]|nr:chemotaxis response regulator protein-glutamate methylesterase [Spirochaetales bacterium]